jgi:predicted RNase H-like HicB family nuclease
MTRRRFKIILEPENEGGFSVTVPALPGCATQGETLEECFKNATEAIKLYIQSLIDDNIAVPESDVLMEEVEVVV